MLWTATCFPALLFRGVWYPNHYDPGFLIVRRHFLAQLDFIQDPKMLDTNRTQRLAWDSGSQLTVTPKLVIIAYHGRRQTGSMIYYNLGEKSEISKNRKAPKNRRCLCGRKNNTEFPFCGFCRAIRETGHGHSMSVQIASFSGLAWAEPMVSPHSVHMSWDDVHSPCTVYSVRRGWSLSYPPSSSSCSWLVSSHSSLSQKWSRLVS